MSETIKETIENLRTCAVDEKHRRIDDWAALAGEDLEGWEAFEEVECQECGQSFVMSSRMGHDECRYICPEIEDEDGEEAENECMGMIEEEVGPMMNLFYPCPLDDPEEAARAISHLPLCVVVFEDGETGFSLTGGGMDLSWEICAAYIACGYLPPVEFCDLPDMAGRGRYKDTALVLAGCQRSCEVAEGWAARKRERLAKLAQGYEIDTE